MRRAVKLTVGAGVLTGALAAIHPAFADYGAIAYDRNNRAWGRAWNYPDQAGADSQALQQCTAGGGQSCEVLVRLDGQVCGAIAAVTDQAGYGWAIRDGLPEAQRVAVEQCENYTPLGMCEVVVSLCWDGPPKQ